MGRNGRRHAGYVVTDRDIEAGSGTHEPGEVCMLNCGVKINRVRDTDGHEFRQAADIYMVSFPANETRPVEKTREMLLESDAYRLYVAQADGVVAAFALVYAWEEFTLLDYMAVSAKFQNRGIGSEMFLELAGRLECDTMLLEVQRPDGIDHKKADRLRFYGRLGSRIIADGYMLPSYDGSEPEEMYLMAVAPARRRFRRDDVRAFVRKIYRDVYGHHDTGLLERTMLSVPG